MQKSDIALGAFVLVPILFLIIPVPLFLLDLMFALNISIAMVILFNALFSKEALDMSSFPTLLLLTTLFRLALNVSSTRN
ncbi:MAG: FHIPEP family type III secretion protein, partial [Eubacterium sp.]|nr:FHIPEP family type III secretion protein [Eubacterium sp.]